MHRTTCTTEAATIWLAPAIGLALWFGGVHIVLWLLSGAPM